jgi:hypothetical protein
MKSIDLIAIDIDGTLLQATQQISDRVINAVSAAKKRGVKVVLASARPPRSVREIYDQLQLDTLQVNYNGALIHDQLRRRHIHHRPLDGRLIKRIIKAARRSDPEVIVSLEVLDKWYTDRQNKMLTTETSRNFSPDYVGPLDAFLHAPVTKLMLLTPAERMAPIRQLVEQRFSSEVGIMVSDKHVLQIVHPTVDKGRALAMIAEQYGIAGQNAMAIGDAPNDLGMFAWARLSVAVENAWPQVRDAADVIVATAEDDGVAQAIERFVLN